MNEQPLNYSQNTPAPASQQGIIANISQKIPPKVKDFFSKFYANKKVFWPVAGAAGAILLIIIAGLLFGRKPVMQVSTKPKATPTQNQTGSQASPSPDQLSQIQINLGKIKDQIISLDVAQAPLQPPAVEFKISF